MSPQPPTDPKAATRVFGLNTAEIMGKYLKGGKAEFAGGDLKGKPRVYGALYASNFNIEFFEQQLKKYGLKLASKAEYTVPVNESLARRRISRRRRRAAPHADHQTEGRRRAPRS